MDKENLKYILLVLAILFPALTIASSSPAQPLRLPIETADQDRAFSEFNHHLAGCFVLAIGILAFMDRFSKRFSFAGKVWPFLFILPGLYLALMSDPEVWPMGTESWVNIFRDNPEAVQHKIYAVLLIAFGTIEIQRSRGKLGKIAALWSFPMLALFGAILLFFHKHGVEAEEMSRSMPGMHHGEHMMSESMAKIKTEHFWFSLVGFGVIASKFISDAKFWKRPFVPFLWPVFMSVLGVLLLFYSE